MWSYRNVSIKTKLMLLVLLSGGVALLLAATCFVIVDVSIIRSSMAKQMLSLAEVLGSNNTAALQFEDADRAKELLNSLREQPSVIFACIYGPAGQAFAAYHRGPNKFRNPPPPQEMGARFSDEGYLDVASAMIHDGHQVGIIYLRASMEELHEQMWRYLGIVAGMLIISLGGSIAISNRLQRLISVPILKLAETAQQVSTERDFSVRVVKTANDELGRLYDNFNEMLEQIQQGEAAVQKARDELEAKVLERTAALSRANQQLSRENSVRVQAELALESTHHQLMDAARRAGMAEIATGVLHNVGNVLNSINVSATLTAEHIRKLNIADLARAVALIHEHSAGLTEFITSDPKGRHLPDFLSLLAKHLGEERAGAFNELEHLMTQVEHVKAIVSTQQAYANVSGVIEVADLAMMLDDALRLNATAFEQHQIQVVKQYAFLPKLKMDKQKVLQIVVNLVKNAMEAFLECPDQTNRQVIVRTSLSAENKLRIQVIDNGIGIARENQTRIFSHGFTTKQNGHGFGLHSSANAANEMGGSLVVESDGLGAGAAFTLELPYAPVDSPVCV